MSYIGKQPTKAALTASDIEDGIITAAKIEDGAVVAAEIASNAVTTAKINADAVTGAKIANKTITGGEIQDNVVLVGTVTVTSVFIQGSSPGYISGPPQDDLIIRSNDDLVFQSIRHYPAMLVENYNRFLIHKIQHYP